ncbi:hypothetical protein GCM10010967_21520 [Dyadobacter beijingensis]|uniref:Lipocalin-like domain-containing protein n=1 Tax=Dyadobacter beijingensis TaxID=365489 RepID=A0ABQ2HQC5_9BACT|nr:hypothetical protein [Dyadobacter beijingensis]GGM88547.1 hypothetical protein GCM10010967_21520 [Dyadobacter beijingensis]
MTNLRPLLIVLLFSSVFSCRTREQELQGVWRTDSISNFVNGFSFTNNTFDEHWSTFEYGADGVMTERKKEKFKTYRYQLPSSDSLVYTDSTGQRLSGFQIVKLSDEHLILKKAQKPYLPGKNQELYEVRFFTKLPAEK